ncbi:MAG: hypothetical protein H0U59_00635, partial [Gemmatimonadaceae bacterium]|nr:hypothetical protein [Gemmatimonadaceae bacterium]
GVFRNTTGGLGAWTQVNNGLNSILNDGIDDDWDGKAGTVASPEADESVSGSHRIELSVHNSTNNNVVYCVMTGNDKDTPKIMGVWRSIDQGANWVQMPKAGLPAGKALPDFNPGGQGEHHQAILADRNNPNVVFVSGDQRPSVWRADISATPVWVNMSGAAANNTNPHSDSRDMVFNAAGDILQADDGGIYRLLVPNNDVAGVTRQWDSRVGNLRISEVYSAAYDSINKTMFGALQDNGIVEQARGAGLFNPWQYVSNGGDGTIVQIAYSADGTKAHHYSTTQNFGQFTRRIYDNTGNTPVVEKPAMRIIGTSTATITGIGSWNGKFDRSAPFTTQFAINAVDPDRILVGTSYLYESYNGGTGFFSIGGIDSSKVNDATDDDFDGTPAPPPAAPVAALDLDEVEVTGKFGRVTAMAYGGRSGGINEPNIAYVAAGRRLAFRETIVDAKLTDYFELPYNDRSLKGGNIRDIALDPEERRVGWVVDDKAQVFLFENGGTVVADWKNITGNLKKLTYDLHSVTVIRSDKAPLDDVVLVGGSNGVFATDNPFLGENTVWRKVGTGLPAVAVRDVRYDPSDVLSVGTWGRGAWKITDFLTKFYPATGARASLSALDQDQVESSPLEPLASSNFVGPLTSLAFLAMHAPFVGPVLLSEPQIVPAAIAPGDPGALEITGDDSEDKDDVIRLVLDPADPDMLQVFVNNTSEEPDAVVDVDSIPKVFVTGGEGADRLVIDQANGLIKFAEGIDFTDFVVGVDSQEEINFTEINAGVVGKIRKGLAGLATWANKLSQVSEAAQKLPAVGVSLSDLFKVGDGSGAIGGVLQQGLVDRLSQYFTSDVTPTVQELVDRMKSISSGVGDVLFGIDPSSVIGALTNDNGHQELRFDLALSVDAFRDQLTLDFGADAESLGLKFDANATVNLAAKLNLDFAFGVDLTPGLSDEEAFFLQIDDLSLNARVSAGAAPVHAPLAR